MNPDFSRQRTVVATMHGIDQEGLHKREAGKGPRHSVASVSCQISRGACDRGRCDPGSCNGQAPIPPKRKALHPFHTALERVAKCSSSFMFLCKSKKCCAMFFQPAAPFFSTCALKGQLPQELQNPHWHFSSAHPPHKGTQCHVFKVLSKGVTDPSDVSRQGIQVLTCI